MSKMATNEDLLLRLDKTIMGIDPNRPHMSRHPQLHKGMNPVFMTMRSEMHYLKKLNIEERRRKLKQLQIQDFLQQDKELRQVGLAFINRFQ